jgi:hypothetical protein
MWRDSAAYGAGGRAGAWHGHAQPEPARVVHDGAPRQAVISLATERSYATSLARLERSLVAVGFAGERLLWRPGQFPAGCPSHYESPFAFKPYCFAEAQANGLRHVLWLDATCVVIRPLDPIFDQIGARGYVLYRHVFRLGEWASDVTLAAYGLDRETALDLPEVNACVMGLYLENRLPPSSSPGGTPRHARARRSAAPPSRSAPSTTTGPRS